MRSTDLSPFGVFQPVVVAALLSALTACTTPARQAPPDTSRDGGSASRQGVMILDEVPPPAVVSRPPPRPDPGSDDRSSPVVVPARPLVRLPPDYPAALREQGIEGRVVASVAVSASGQVEAVTIRSATDPLFEQAVRAALKRWRFEPARSQSGQAVPSRVQIPFRFRVE